MGKMAAMNKTDAKPEPLAERVMREGWEAIKFVGGVAAIYFGLTTIAFATYHIPSESMQPNLEVGDRVAVSKFSYGWSRHSLPLGSGRFLPSGLGRLLGRAPGRGDVVVFSHPRSGEILIKRVVGLPGDTVETRGGRLLINNVAVERDLETRIRYRAHQGLLVEANRYREALPDAPQRDIFERSDSYPLDNAGPFNVPAGHVFVMGDNRDSSSDSRAPEGPGFVPLENIVGQAITVIYTLKSCRREAGLECPSGRVWRPL